MLGSRFPLSIRAISDCATADSIAEWDCQERLASKL
jgi:hypothetical protein